MYGFTKLFAFWVTYLHFSIQFCMCTNIIVKNVCCIISVCVLLSVFLVKIPHEFISISSSYSPVKSHQFVAIDLTLFVCSAPTGTDILLIPYLLFHDFFPRHFAQFDCWLVFCQWFGNDLLNGNNVVGIFKFMLWMSIINFLYRQNTYM